MKIDLILKNAKVFNSYYKNFISGDVGVLKGKILFIDRNKSMKYIATKEINCEGAYLIPGFIDVHMHIESSMTTPEIFSNEVKKYGITTIVEEPHEIANVAGMKGIKEFLESERNCPIDIFYGIPSSVPSTNENLETTGGRLGYEDMKKISKWNRVICVGEVMNYRGVIKDKNLEIVKFLDYVREYRKDLVIEGHCPRLKGLDLSKFLYLGINGDHTEHSFEEIVERFENGMFVELQEKMIKEEILNHIKEYNLFEQVAFVTDDIMPDYLLEKGHLNNVVKKAIEKGFRVEDAIYCATMTAAKRMRLYDRGTIAPGKIGDMVLIEDLESLRVLKTFKDGEIIYSKEDENKYSKGSYKFSGHIYNSIKLDPVKENALVLNSVEEGKVTCRVIKVNDGGTATEEVFKELEVKDGRILWEESDCVLVAVFDRYKESGSVGLALATGDLIKKGAIATTYAHDCHNLLVVGKTVEEMILAANKVIENQGGIVAVKGEKVLSNIKLNIGGILSEEPMNNLGKKIKSLKKNMVRLGYNHYNPIMSLCTLTLPVSPALKVTDKGLIDVKKGKVVPIVVKKKKII